MARARSNGNGKWEEGMEELRRSQLAMQQAQATMLQTVAVIQQTHASDMAKFQRESDELKRKSDERFARIEAILLEHNRILTRLADTLGEKIGFKASAGLTNPEQ